MKYYQAGDDLLSFSPFPSSTSPMIGLEPRLNELEVDPRSQEEL